MQVDVRGRDVIITQGLRAYIERRLAFALGRFASRIRKVVVRVVDLNGPRRGIDTRCQLAICMEPLSTIVIKDRASSVYVAIDSLAGKASNCLRRRLQRAHGHNPWQKLSELLYQESQALVVPLDLRGGARVHKNAPKKDSGS